MVLSNTRGMVVAGDTVHVLQGIRSQHPAGRIMAPRSLLKFSVLFVRIVHMQAGYCCTNSGRQF